MKAVFLYNFTRFIDWPAASFTAPDSPFIIAVYGSNPFGPFIEEAITGEMIGTHPILVRYYSDLSDIGNCHILYINNNDPAKVKEAIDALAGKNILTVSDFYDFPKSGGIIKFFTEDNKIRLEINANAAKAAQLNISSKLLSVAKIYQ